MLECFGRMSRFMAVGGCFRWLRKIAERAEAKLATLAGLMNQKAQLKLHGRKLRKARRSSHSVESFACKSLKVMENILLRRIDSLYNTKVVEGGRKIDEIWRCRRGKMDKIIFDVIN